MSMEPRAPENREPPNVIVNWDVITLQYSVLNSWDTSDMIVTDLIKYRDIA